MLEVTRSALFLTPVQKGRPVIFGTPRVFALPETIRQNGVFSNLLAFAKFVKDCIRNENLRTNKILFCLDDSVFITKEYQHLPCKKNSLLSFAKLEAESVLPDSVDEYVIENYEYGLLNEITGKMSSSLYAVKDALISEIIRSFRSFRLNVIKIIPPVVGLLNAARAGVDTTNSAVAVLELGFKTHLLLFHNGYPVLQRSFDSVLDDLINLQMESRSISYKEAYELILAHGIYGTDTPNLEDEENQRITTLLDVGMNEIVRNLRMALSSERLDLEKLVLCGTMTMLPHFVDFWDQLDLGVPFEISDNCATGELPQLEASAKEAGYQPTAFFGARGMLTANKSEDIDFLKYKRAQQSQRTTTIFLFAFITVLTVGVMLLEPLLYYEKCIAYSDDDASLNSYAEIQSLLKTQGDLNATLSKIKSDRDKLPTEKSNSRETVKQLLLQISAKAQSIDSFEIDNSTGTVTVEFIVPSYSNYLEIKKEIQSQQFFTVDLPISIDKDDGNAYRCKLILKQNGFVPYSENKGGDSK